MVLSDARGPRNASQRQTHGLPIAGLRTKRPRVVAAFSRRAPAKRGANERMSHLIKKE